MNNIYVIMTLVVIGVIIVFGIPIYCVMKFYDWVKAYADCRIIKMLDRAKDLSAPINKHDITLYSIYGFLNITTEYRMKVYLNDANLDEMERLAIELRGLSYRLSIYTLRIHGILIIWWNYRSILSKIQSMRV